MVHKKLIMLVFALALFTTTTWAQDAEVTLFGGIRLGGDFNFDFVNPLGGFSSTDLDVANTANYGIILNIPVNDYTQFELFYDHQGSELSTGDPITLPDQEPRVLSTDLSIDYYQAGAQYHRPETMVRPFIAVTLGVAQEGRMKDHSVVQFKLDTRIGR